MDSSFTNETALRKYLLGTLEPQGCDEIEEQLLSNEEFARLIDLIEDEIIEEYVDGSLPPKDRETVETYFLRPPSRQKKLKFARMLRTQFREEAKVQPVSARVSSTPRWRWFYWVAAGGMAAMLVITALLGFYAAKLRRDLEAETARSRRVQSELDWERRLNADIKKAALLRQVEQASQLTSNNATLVRSDRYVTLRPSPVLTMGSGNTLPTYRPRPGNILKIVIPLMEMPPGPYRVSLLNPRGMEIWSQASISASPGNQLVFPIPQANWQPGDYWIRLAGISGNPAQATYYFRVAK